MDVYLREREYDTQLFGFGTNNFMIAIKSLVKEEVSKFAELMCGALIKKYPSKDHPDIEKVKRGVKSLVQRYIVSSQEPLKLLEGQLNELLHIPPHVLLHQDSVQRTQYTAEDEKQVDLEVSNLLLRIERTMVLDVELAKELKVLKDTLPLLKHRVMECRELDEQRHIDNKILLTLEPLLDEMLKDRLQSLNID